VITTVASLLRELQAKDSEKLAQENITHAPTIGAMYEGLTRDILDRAIPPSLDLRIVDGFVEDHQGNLSPQTDAMLVSGHGRRIPHTSGYVWPVQDVLAVLEVKKNLYGADLDDAFRKLRVINDMHGAYMRQNQKGKFTITPSYNAFARLTGRYPRNRKDIDALPDELSFIFHNLVCEQLSPVRIIFGYEGYVDEMGLRKGFFDFLNDNLATSQGFGIGSFPNLIVCRKNSLLKMNGHPYMSPMADGWWPAVVSNSDNPIRLLIELIWTRLSNHFETAFPMDDTLQMERLAPFLSARFKQDGERRGWEYRLERLTKKQLAEVKPFRWSPNAIDENEGVVLFRIGQEGELDTRDPEFRNYAKEQGFDPDRLIAKLVQDRTLAWRDDHSVRLISSSALVTTFMPSGEVVATAETDLLNLWLAEELSKEKSRPTD
jgi:hypothetical protein